MKMMYLAVGYNCNHDCYFCPIGDKTTRIPEASLDAMKKAIDSAIDSRQVDGITLSGGEPTLNPSFPNVIDYCEEKGLAIGILSNGENFCDEENIDRYFGTHNPGTISVTTAIHSHIPELHEKLNGTQGSFDKTVKGLQNLMDRGFSVTVKQIVCRQNYNSLPDFVDFVYDMSNGRASLELCGMDYCGMSPEKTESVAVGFDKIGRMLEKAMDRVDGYRCYHRAFPQAMITDLPLCCTDPYYWRYFLASSRFGTDNYAMPESQNNMHQIDDLEGDCGLFYKGCMDCAMKRECPGVWSYTAKYYPNPELIGIHAISVMS